MDTPQEQIFQQARRHLGWSYQSSRGDRFQGGRAPTFEQSGQMRCHGPRDKPG